MNQFYQRVSLQIRCRKGFNHVARSKYPSSPNSKYVAVGFSSNQINAVAVTDNCLKIFSLRTFDLIKNLSIYPDRYEKLGLIPELNYFTPNGIHKVVFSIDGKRLAAITLNGDVFIWDIVNEFDQTGLFFRKNHQIAWDISPNFKFVIYTNESLRNEVDSCFYLKDIQSDTTIVQFKTPKATFFEAYFSNSLKYIVTVSGRRATQNEYNIWNIQTHEWVGNLQGNAKMMWKPTFDKDENYMVGAGEYGKVNLWDIHTGNLLLSFQENKVNDYPYILFSPDQKYLVYNSEDKTIKYWEIASWIGK